MFTSDGATHSEKPVVIEDLDLDTQRDLRRQLKYNRRHIRNRYASFVVSLCNAVIGTNVSLKDFRLYLLGLPAFENDHEGEQPILLDDVKTKIENADSIHRIFEVLTTDCCSFLNIDIFESIMDKYKINTDSDEYFKYSGHLKAYLKNHEISEFIMINPKLESFTKDSEILTLKFNVALPNEITKVLDLKDAIAGILGVKSCALRLVSIKKGCVVVAFLIPATVANYIFASGLTAKQEADIQAQSVLWLECGDYKLEETSCSRKLPAYLSEICKQ